MLSPFKGAYEQINGKSFWLRDNVRYLPNVTVVHVEIYAVKPRRHDARWPVDLHCPYFRKALEDMTDVPFLRRLEIRNLKSLQSKLGDQNDLWARWDVDLGWQALEDVSGDEKAGKSQM